MYCGIFLPVLFHFHIFIFLQPERRSAPIPLFPATVMIVFFFINQSLIFIIISKKCTIQRLPAKILLFFNNKSASFSYSFSIFGNTKIIADVPSPFYTLSKELLFSLTYRIHFNFVIYTLPFSVFSAEIFSPARVTSISFSCISSSAFM